MASDAASGTSPHKQSPIRGEAFPVVGSDDEARGAERAGKSDDGRFSDVAVSPHEIATLPEMLQADARKNPSGTHSLWCPGPTSSRKLRPRGLRPHPVKARIPGLARCPSLAHRSTFNIHTGARAEQSWKLRILPESIGGEAIPPSSLLRDQPQRHRIAPTSADRQYVDAHAISWCCQYAARVADRLLFNSDARFVSGIVVSHGIRVRDCPTPTSSCERRALEH